MMDLFLIIVFFANELDEYGIRSITSFLLHLLPFVVIIKFCYIGIKLLYVQTKESLHQFKKV